jgi:membrane protein YdbS with pleckstrin-like domain
VTFQQEFVLARIRRRSSVLLLPHLALFLSVFTLSFFSGKVFENWITISVNVAVGLVAFLFWVIPSWRYATEFLEVTTTRLIQRGGLFGRVRREVSHSQVIGIEHSRSRGLVLNILDAEPLVLTKMPKPKQLAEELRRALAK